MKKISLEYFKKGCEIVADLIISLDENFRAILKPRNAISEFINSKPLWEQLFIVQELLNMYDFGLISEKYLNNKDALYWSKISFEKYLQFLHKSIESKITYEDYTVNEKTITSIEDNLKGMNNKSLKINYLLKLKKYFEGNYPKETKEFLKSDDVYQFINQQLNFWERYVEISIEPRPLPQLSTNLSQSQREKLFDLLAKNGFIQERNKEFFNWSFGAPNEKQPQKWQPIIWVKNKQLLRELLINLKIPGIKVADIEKVVPLIFHDKLNNPINLAKNKHVESTDSDLIKEIIEKIATT